MAVNVYFISGMCANCHVFDQLQLPEGFNKLYIEWIMPDENGSLTEYSRKMAAQIDTNKPFILAGYSFGGIIIQEMNNFLKPEKNILIASVKSDEEFPPLFRLGRKINFAEKFHFWSLVDNDRVKDLFTKYIYRIGDTDMSKYVSYTDPVYMRWCVSQMLNWTPSQSCPNLYHIHGTRDSTFPHRYIKKAYLVKRGDHLMVMKRAKQVSDILAEILSGKAVQIS